MPSGYCDAPDSVGVSHERADRALVLRRVHDPRRPCPPSAAECPSPRRARAVDVEIAAELDQAIIVDVFVGRGYGPAPVSRHDHNDRLPAVHPGDSTPKPPMRGTRGPKPRNIGGRGSVRMM